MNHCIDCGWPVSTGRCQATGEEYRCMACRVAQDMATFRYVSPAMKRWARRKGQNHGSQNYTHAGAHRSEASE